VIHTHILSLMPDSLEKKIIDMRYLQRRPMSWGKIAYKLHYSSVWIKQKDERIIEDIAKRCVFKQKK